MSEVRHLYNSSSILMQCSVRIVWWCMQCTSLSLFRTPFRNWRSILLFRTRENIFMEPREPTIWDQKGRKSFGSKAAQQPQTTHSGKKSKDDVMNGWPPTNKRSNKLFSQLTNLWTFSTDYVSMTNPQTVYNIYFLKGPEKKWSWEIDRELLIK